MNPNDYLDRPSQDLGNLAEWDPSCVTYKERVGTLSHLSNTVRPDIAFSTSFLSPFMGCFQVQHWRAAKQVLRYLIGTAEEGIMYQGKRGTDFVCEGYSDSDFAGFRIERKSTSGHICLAGGGAVSWRSKKQTVVAQSSVESEYISSSFAIRECSWLLQLLREFCRGQPKSMVLHCDNQGTMSLAKEARLTE